MTLIVIHRHDRIVLARAKLNEHRLPRDRPRDVHSVCPALGDDRRADFDVLPTEQSALAGMGVEGGDGDARLRDPKIEHRFVGGVDRTARPFRRQQFWHILQRNMRGDVADPHVAMRRQHHRAFRPRQRRQHVGVAGQTLDEWLKRAERDSGRALGADGAAAPAITG